MNKKRTTSITKINDIRYLRIPKSVILEKDIKDDDDFVALKTKQKDNISFRRINTEIKEDE